MVGILPKRRRAWVAISLEGLEILRDLGGWFVQVFGHDELDSWAASCDNLDLEKSRKILKETYK